MRCRRRGDTSRRIWGDVVQWVVRLRSIEWDDGDGLYDVSQLPRSLDLFVEAPVRDAAIEYAMDDASDTYGSLIQGCDASASVAN